MSPALQTPSRLLENELFTAEGYASYIGSTAVIVNIAIAVVNCREGEEVPWVTELLVKCLP